MKRLVSIIFLVLIYNVSNAQTVDEWLKQKETQKKYLVQQIVSFKIYLGYVQKGYTIARKGLTTISNIKDGDFNIHKDFISSFKSVNPTIRKYSKVADIIAFQFKIIQTYKSASKQIKASSLFSPSDIDYVYRVFTNLIHNCAGDIDELITVITANGTEIKDDERLKRIDALYASMQDKYAFAKSFGEEAQVLAVQRAREKNNVEISRSLYGIKN